MVRRAQPDYVFCVFAALALLPGLAGGLEAQPTVGYGDVVVTSSQTAVNENGEAYDAGSLVVFSRTGQRKGVLAIFSQAPLSDPIVRDGIIYVATRWPAGIQRFDLSGRQLTPLTTAVQYINYLAPGPDGGLLAVNGSCELYQFAADGSLVRFRDDPAGCGGVELAHDGCTVYRASGDSILRWNACIDTPAEVVARTQRPDAFGTLRLLPDGTFLVAMQNDASILRLAHDGAILRNYGIRGKGLALDVDGTSFWTNQFGTVMRVDIASGTVLSQSYHGRTDGISVVGEPRAGLLAAHGVPAVPTLTSTLLAVLAVFLAVVGWGRIH